MRESCKNVEYLTNSNPYNFITFSYNILEAAKFRTYEEAKNCEDQVFDMLYWQGKNQHEPGGTKTDSDTSLAESAQKMEC
jgi:hypothetical protein